MDVQNKGNEELKQQTKQHQQCQDQGNSTSLPYIRDQLAVVRDMTMSGWKPTISLIHPSIPYIRELSEKLTPNFLWCGTVGVSLGPSIPYKIFVIVHPKDIPRTTRNEVWWYIRYSARTVNKHIHRSNRRNIRLQGKGKGVPEETNNSNGRTHN